MKLNRRQILASAAALSMFGTRSWAVTKAEFENFIVQSVSDGKLVLPVDFLVARGTDPTEALTILDDAGVTGDTYDSPLNLTLMTRGDETILFDAGSGPDFMPTAGKLHEGLAAIGVSPEQVTHVVFTHAHPDHIWGVLDDFDEPAFVNARYMIGRIERDYWLDPSTPETIEPTRLSFVAGAKRRIETLGELLETFEDGDEILPNIKAIMTPGHTPGHMSFDLAGQLFVAGDIVTNPHLAFSRPAVLSGSDQAPEIAAETRYNTLNMLSNSDIKVLGYHLPQGGIGRVRRKEDGFDFLPG